MLMTEGSRVMPHFRFILISFDKVGMGAILITISDSSILVCKPEIWVYVIVYVGFNGHTSLEYL